MTEVLRQCFETQPAPAVVVIDSAKALRDFADEKLLRKAIYDLASRVAHTGVVLLFVGEYSEDEIERLPEFALSDGILQLAYEPHEPIDRRWLRVVKMRGARHLSGKHSSASRGPASRCSHGSRRSRQRRSRLPKTDGFLAASANSTR